MARITLLILSLFIYSISKENQDTLVFPYGLAQYRLIGDYYSATDSSNKNSNSLNFSNKVAICFGFYVKYKSLLLFHFQFGNDWLKNEQIGYPSKQSAILSEIKYFPFLFPFVHLAYIKWTPGPFFIAAGKMKIDNFGALDLIERTVVSNNYDGTAFIGWSDAINNSIIGIRTGIIGKSKTFCFSSDFFTTIIKRLQSNKNSLLGVFNLQFQNRHFSLHPQVALFFNKYPDSISSNIKLEKAIGLTTYYYVNELVSLNLTSAWSHFETIDETFSKDIVPKQHNSFNYDHNGFQLGLGSSIKCGSSIMILNSKYSKSGNRNAGHSEDHFLSNNFIFKLILHPNMFVTAQIRFFHIFSSQKDYRLYAVRPEIIFDFKI